MCGNRVEELESRVQELEASVEGLTDELVECKLRLRELEKASDEDLGVVAHSGANDTLESDIDEATTEAEEPAPEESAEAEDDASNSDADDGEDETEEPGSDIIIA